MTPKTKKKSSRNFPRARIAYAVRKAIPKGQPFKVHVSDSKLGNMKVVRVVTRAWKTRRPAFRISRVLDAADHVLTPSEQKRILRFSVLTPKEYKTIVRPKNLVMLCPAHHGAARKKTARLRPRNRTPKLGRASSKKRKRR
jgi:hypothetical protein